MNGEDMQGICCQSCSKCACSRRVLHKQEATGSNERIKPQENDFEQLVQRRCSRRIEKSFKSSGKSRESSADCHNNESQSYPRLHGCLSQTADRRTLFLGHAMSMSGHCAAARIRSPLLAAIIELSH